MEIFWTYFGVIFALFSGSGQLRGAIWLPGAPRTPLGGRFANVFPKNGLVMTPELPQNLLKVNQKTFRLHAGFQYGCLKIFALLHVYVVIITGNAMKIWQLILSIKISLEI